MFVKFLISDFGGKLVALENSDLYVMYFFKSWQFQKNHTETSTVAFQRNIVLRRWVNPEAV